MGSYFDINSYPKACVIGIKGGLIAFIVGITGHSLNYFLNLRIGYWFSLAGILGVFLCIAIFYKGFFFDKNDKIP